MNKQVTLYIQAKKRSYGHEFEIEVDTMEFESDQYTTYVTLDTQTVNVEIPEFDEKVLVLAEVEQLKAAIKSKKAAHYLEVTAIEEKINSLMCLENQVQS